MLILRCYLQPNQPLKCLCGVVVNSSFGSPSSWHLSAWDYLRAGDTGSLSQWSGECTTSALGVPEDVRLCPRELTSA